MTGFTTVKAQLVVHTTLAFLRSKFTVFELVGIGGSVGTAGVRGGFPGLVGIIGIGIGVRFRSGRGLVGIMSTARGLRIVLVGLVVGTIVGFGIGLVGTVLLAKSFPVASVD